MSESQPGKAATQGPALLMGFAAGTFATVAGLGFGAFLPTDPGDPARVGSPAPRALPAHADETLLHLEIGAALLATAIDSGQIERADIAAGLDGLGALFDDANPALPADVSESVKARLDAMRANMDALDPAAAAREARMLHVLLKARRAMGGPS
ncbi:hypothetical protein [Novosphingobium album (ex Liu et al. 2023)]|uniref:Periplasmic heavy metal sensor n=1 Tax=Novosphingobium album (ex Liu et al. 2023) TaxID=3031130 RepID=A0ABT5WVQ4_9SPHN|nr:hypothetical protein [Novosphingobium album (ex Liu et al. 2023)]MDE8653967.1 hypothetical protein [Novosphingobium album (ex Liu et al. 2023)]